METPLHTLTAQFLPDYTGSPDDVDAILTAAEEAGCLRGLAAAVLTSASGPERAALPIDEVGPDGTCPTCSKGQLCLTDYPYRTWPVIGVEGSALVVLDDYDAQDLCATGSVWCDECFAEWAMPQDVTPR